jgi:glycosyltransferase involved in cell wall biosynthesis
MAQMYKGLDVVVSASTQPEPFGVVVVEAMAMKRPVIAPNHGGAAEIIESKVTGLLFDPGDAQSLAQAIEKLYSSPSLYINLGQNARSAVVKSFSIEGHVKRIQAIYEELLD